MKCPTCSMDNDEAALVCWCGRRLPRRGTSAHGGSVEQGVGIPQKRDPQDAAELDVGNGSVLVGPAVVRYGDKTLSTPAIDRIWWGVEKTSVNAVRVDQSYKVALSDGAETIQIECASDVLSSTATYEYRYKTLLELLWPHVTSRIIQGMLEQYHRGDWLTFTDWRDSLSERRAVRFDLQLRRDGFASTLAERPLLFWTLQPKTSMLLWHEYGGYSFDNGRLVIWRRDASAVAPRMLPRFLAARPWPWARLRLREAWNVVCLQWVLDDLTRKR